MSSCDSYGVNEGSNLHPGEQLPMIKKLGWCLLASMPSATSAMESSNPPKALFPGVLKEPTNLQCKWESDTDPIVLEVAEPNSRRLKDSPIATIRTLHSLLTLE